MQKKGWISVITGSLAVGMLAGALMVTHTPAGAQAPNAPPFPGPGAPGGQARPQMGPGQMAPGQMDPRMMGPGQMAPGQMDPRMMRMAMPATITATNEYVYVLRGNTLYQFTAEDLKLRNKTTLEFERPFQPERMRRQGAPGAPAAPGGVPGQGQ